MLAERVYESFTNARKDRKLPIGELLSRRRTAWHDYQTALEREYSANNPLTKFIGRVGSNICELKYVYYDGIILRHPGPVQIANGELGNTTTDIPETFGAEE